MKIQDRNLTGAAAEAGRAQETQRPDRTEGRQAGGAGNSTDRVEFSNALGSLSRALHTYSSERGSRIDALAQQYQSGAYRVDAAAVSRALVDDALKGG